MDPRVAGSVTANENSDKQYKFKCYASSAGGQQTFISAEVTWLDYAIKQTNECRTLLI